MRVPFQVLSFPYLFSDGKFSYCLFRRSDHSYWQGVAGGGEEGETILEAAIRETKEESGLIAFEEIISLKSMCYMPVVNVTGEFTWGKEHIVIPEYSFGFRVKSRDEIKLSDEHHEFRWLSFLEAMSALKWDSNKNALWELDQTLRLKHATP